jgi:hypothetical protein
MKDGNITDITTYLARHSDEIGDRILSSYPVLYGADEAPSPLLSRMVRVPYPAQTLAIMGVSKRWQLLAATPSKIPPSFALTFRP